MHLVPVDEVECRPAGGHDEGGGVDHQRLLVHLDQRLHVDVARLLPGLHRLLQTSGHVSWSPEWILHTELVNIQNLCIT